MRYSFSEGGLEQEVSRYKNSGLDIKPDTLMVVCVIYKERGV